MYANWTPQTKFPHYFCALGGGGLGSILMTIRAVLQGCREVTGAQRDHQLLSSLVPPTFFCQIKEIFIQVEGDQSQLCAKMTPK